jgi:hypothetical protein
MQNHPDQLTEAIYNCPIARSLHTKYRLTPGCSLVQHAAGGLPADRGVAIGICASRPHRALGESTANEFARQIAAGRALLSTQFLNYTNV